MCAERLFSQIILRIYYSAYINALVRFLLVKIQIVAA